MAVPPVALMFWRRDKAMILFSAVAGKEGTTRNDSWFPAMTKKWASSGNNSIKAARAFLASWIRRPSPIEPEQSIITPRVKGSGRLWTMLHWIVTTALTWSPFSGRYGFWKTWALKSDIRFLNSQSPIADSQRKLTCADRRPFGLVLGNFGGLADDGQCNRDVVGAALSTRVLDQGLGEGKQRAGFRWDRNL